MKMIKMNVTIDTRETDRIRPAMFYFSIRNQVSIQELETGDYIFEELKKRRIFVRHWNKPRIADYLRITIGSDEEMKRLYEALNDIIQSERK